MTPADTLLNHFDRIAGSEPHFTRVSEEGVQPALFVASYRGFPEPTAVTGFTIGLSLSHPQGGGHKELTISMRDDSPYWAFACGELAYRLSDRCGFHCGDVINFNTEISPSSRMSAFIVAHPQHLRPTECTVDLGVRVVEIVQLVPIYEQERVWLAGGGDLKVLLTAGPKDWIMDPRREPLDEM